MNPHAYDPLHVEPYGKAWALVEGLGVITTHKTKPEAETALAAERNRRANVKAAIEASRQALAEQPASDLARSPSPTQAKR